MANIKQQLRDDLTAAIKARDELTMSVVRMALTAISTKEVAGKAARELTDAEVLSVLAQEAKKRREAAEAFAGAGRAELAARERAEGSVLARYLPEPLTDEQLTSVVRQAITETGAQSARDIGMVMKALQSTTMGRADGQRVSAVVRQALAQDARP